MAECIGDTVPFHDYNCEACANAPYDQEGGEVNMDFIISGHAPKKDEVGDGFIAFMERIESDPEVMTEISALTAQIKDLEDQVAEYEHSARTYDLAREITDMTIAQMSEDEAGHIEQISYAVHTLRAIALCPDVKVSQVMALAASVALVDTDDDE